MTDPLDTIYLNTLAQSPRGPVEIRIPSWLLDDLETPTPPDAVVDSPSAPDPSKDVPGVSWSLARRSDLPEIIITLVLVVGAVILFSWIGMR